LWAGLLEELSDIKVIVLAQQWINMTSKLPNVHDLSAQTSIDNLIYFLQNFMLVTANDSALMDLAAALSIPVISLFGSIDPKIGPSPINSKHDVVIHPEIDNYLSLPSKKSWTMFYNLCYEYIINDQSKAILKGNCHA
jgi:ADP-heptose:LPS heptosyltransferase